MSDEEPRIGLFWGLPQRGGFRFVGVSRPMSRVEAVGGFRTHPAGHAQVWPRIVRRRPELAGTPYDAVPRGRVNWTAEGDRFLLLLDPRLRTPAFVAEVTRRWRLPAPRTDVRLDAHYRT